jgi:Dolichyl-phosphate-mannose-protein mannosyltransferase
MVGPAGDLGGTWPPARLGGVGLRTVVAAPARQAGVAQAFGHRARVRRSSLAWLGLALLVGALVKEPEILLPIGPDQGTYSYVAERILAGGLPYVDAWDNKPPGTYYAHAAVLALVPAADRWSRSCLPGVQQECGYLALQLSDLVWTSLSGVAVFAVARRLGFSRGRAVLACGLFLVFANLSQLSREGSTPEKQLLLPMVLAYLAALRGGARGVFLGGLFAGVAFLFKQTAVSIPLALLAWVAWQRRPGKLTRGVWFGAGWLAPTAVTVAFFAAHGALGPLWEASFGYNVVQAGSSALAVPRGALSGAWHVFANSSALLWLLGLGGGLLVVSSWRPSLDDSQRDATEQPADPIGHRAGPRSDGGGAELAAWDGEARAVGGELLLVCWAVADALSLGLGGAKFAQVYFVQLVPSLALLAALAVAEGWRLTRGLPLMRAYAGIVGLAIFLLSNQFQASVVLRAFWERTPPHASVPLERLVAGRLPPGRPVFVWGDNSEIYLYASAFSPSRFFHTFPLSHQYTGGTGYLDRRAELLKTWQEKNPPEVVAIDPAPARDDPDGRLGLNLASFPELAQLLSQEYVAMQDMPGGWRAYRRLER